MLYKTLFMQTDVSVIWFLLSYLLWALCFSLFRLYFHVMSVCTRWVCASNIFHYYCYIYYIFCFYLCLSWDFVALNWILHNVSSCFLFDDAVLVWQENFETQMQEKANQADLVCCFQHLQVPIMFSKMC